MRRAVRALLGLVAALALLAAVGRALVRRGTVGDETSDEFGIAVCFGGVERRCRAAALQRGVVRVVMGGVDLDVREAVLDPDGATLELSALLGGVQLTVPETWRIHVEQDAILGGVDAQVTPAEELPADAPVLRVLARACMGGVAIRATPPEAA